MALADIKCYTKTAHQAWATCERTARAQLKLINMTPEVFKKLGLDKKEAAIYYQLLKLGPNRASTIAYQISLPRTTVQNILIRLEKENIVSKTLQQNVYVFAATDPNNLVRQLEMKKRHMTSKIDSTIEELKKEMPALLHMMQFKKTIPSVTFFQGREGVRKVLFDTLTSATEIKGYANVDAMFQHVKDINDEYVGEREKTEIKKRSLLLDTPFARKIAEGGAYSPKTHVAHKWISSKLYPFALEMNIYDQKVSYITYVEDDFVGIIIENQHIYSMHDSMWNLVWDILPFPERK